tara:strand:- start:254 stop:433 length:180 start_codon:yes stop_codon:yes gene_type:complete
LHGLRNSEAQLAVGMKLPETGKALITVNHRDYKNIVDITRRLAGLGFSLVATRGTAKAL